MEITGWQILYIITAMLFFLIAVLFYKAKDGLLRVLLILHFLTQGIEKVIRLISGFFTDISYSFWNYCTIAGTFIITIFLAIYLYVRFFKFSDKDL